MTALTRSLLVASWLAFTGCRHDKHEPSGGASASASSSAQAVIPGFSVPPLADKVKWRPYPGVVNLGIPAGCRLDLPVKSTPLPKGAVRFVTPQGTTGEILVAVDEDSDGNVDRTGVLTASGDVAHPLPWSKLDAPPIVAKSSEGYIALATEDTGGGTRRAMLWREPGRVEPVVQGDALDIVDGACDAAKCAILTTLASSSAGPGATLLVGDVGKPAATWKRVDLPAGDKSLQPLSIVRLRGDTVTVAMTGGASIATFEVTSDRVTPLGHMESEFGAYEVVLGDAPIAVVPGESVQAACQKDGFPIRLLSPGGTPFEIDGQVPPSSVLTRPLADGFIVAWLSPVSCRHEAREFVRAFLAGKDGKPRSSTMAVGDADGFALGADGNAVTLWLAIGPDLVWLNAHCDASAPPAPSGSTGK